MAIWSIVASIICVWGICIIQIICKRLPAREVLFVSKQEQFHGEIFLFRGGYCNSEADNMGVNQDFLLKLDGILLKIVFNVYIVARNVV